MNDHLQVGLKSDVPVGGLQIALASGDVIGTLYMYHYRGKSTAVEFNFTAGAEVLKRDAEASGRFNRFLNRLASIPGAQRAAETLRGSYASRRPNVRLSELSDGDVRQMVEALKELSRE